MDSNEISGKSIALWVGAALLITVVLVGVVKLAGTKGGAPGENPLVAGLIPVSEKDWVRGTSTGAATLIEYSDFQCPACAAYYPLVERIVSDYSGSLRFVYRYFPLQQHAQARVSAYAAEAAGRQGKFWEMYHLLFEGQQEWADKSSAEKTFESYASKLGLNMEKYRGDVKLSEVKDVIQSDYEGGIKAGVDATPTFYLNGRKLQNPTSYDAFKQLIDAAVATSS